MISEKMQNAIGLADNKLNLLHGWESNSIQTYIDDFFKNSQVEIGYRAQCGSTHLTQKIYNEFVKITYKLKKEGYSIDQENVKHKNAYATLNQGFWNSTIFRLIKN